MKNDFFGQVRLPGAHIELSFKTFRMQLWSSVCASLDEVEDWIMVSGATVIAIVAGLVNVRETTDSISLWFSSS